MRIGGRLDCPSSGWAGAPVPSEATPAGSESAREGPQQETGSALIDSDDTALSVHLRTISSAILVNAVSPFAALSAFFGSTPLPAGKQINATASTYDSPAATVFNGKLYVFWRANDGSNSILLQGWVSWPPGQRINEVDRTPVSLAVALLRPPEPGVDR